MHIAKKIKKKKWKVILFLPYFREKEKKKKNSKIETLSMRRDLIRLGKR